MVKKMKQYIKALSLSASLLMTSTVYSAESSIPALNRLVPYEGETFKDVEIWGQFDFSGKELDFTGTSKGSSSYIDSHLNYFFGLNAGLYKGISVRYNYLFSAQKAVRAQLPKEINTQYHGHDIRLEYSWHFMPTWTLNVQPFGFRNHEVSPTGFLAYQSGDITLSREDGGNIMDINSSDKAYLFGVSLGKSFNDETLKLTAGLETRFLNVDAKFTSPALSGGFFAPIIAKELPQQTPWKEQHLLLTAAFQWQMWEPITVAMDFKHYQIWRNNYQPKAGKQDYNSNQQFDFYLFANVYKGLTLYGHAQIMTHYLLGDVPLTYNTRTNHRFDQLYGFLSGGLSYNF